eukprot:Sspe_Gene.57928::Locus_31781_Transcript_1_1_Confidence_1.000_Length_951::g.57928::m.57928/K07750/E1.14.13.72, SC4MOL, ERG25; methylsterol monooxygenase
MDIINDVRASLMEAAQPLDDKIAAFWADTVLPNTDEFFRLSLMVPLTYYVIFWALNLPLLFFNFFPALNPFERWKVQKEHESLGKVVSMSLNVIFNQAMALTINVLLHNHMVSTGFQSGLDGLPSVVDLAWQVLLCMVLYDTFFFFTHCLLHTQFLYYAIHKTHHTSKVSVGITSAYFHPIDFLLTTLSATLPAQLVSRHVLTQLVWGCVLLLETINAHCGYRLPVVHWIFDTRDHDFHHSHSSYGRKEYRFVNMGSFFLIWDRLFGTRVPCLEWWEAQEEKKKKKKQQ